MATSKAMKVSYHETVKELVELYPPIVTCHKMAAFVGEKEICRNNIAPRCNLGDKCLRSHEVPSFSPTSNDDPISRVASSRRATRSIHAQRSHSLLQLPVSTVRQSDHLVDTRQSRTHSDGQRPRWMYYFTRRRLLFKMHGL
jgi:hypothetical protein